MPSIDELYLAFGRTSRAAQNLEVSVSTLSQFAEALSNGWFTGGTATKEQLIEFADRHKRGNTLGNMLHNIRAHIRFNVRELSRAINSALEQRNYLCHRFFVDFISDDEITIARGIRRLHEIGIRVNKAHSLVDNIFKGVQDAIAHLQTPEGKAAIQKLSNIDTKYGKLIISLDNYNLHNKS